MDAKKINIHQSHWFSIFKIFNILYNVFTLIPAYYSFSSLRPQKSIRNKIYRNHKQECHTNPQGGRTRRCRATASRPCARICCWLSFLDVEFGRAGEEQERLLHWYARIRAQLAANFSHGLHRSRRLVHRINRRLEAADAHW